MANPINLCDYETKFTFGTKQVLKVPDDESCAICSENFDNLAIIAVSRCTHYFHKSCLRDWVCELNASCPICRYDFRNLRQLVNLPELREPNEEPYNPNIDYQSEYAHYKHKYKTLKRYGQTMGDNSNCIIG